MADGDDLLSPDEIEALINASRHDPSAGAAPASSPNADPPSPDEFNPLTAAHSPVPATPGGPRSAASVDHLLQQTENQLAAALSAAPPKGFPPELGAASPFSYPDLGSSGVRSADPMPLASLQDVELDLRIELGRTELLIDEVLKLREGSVVPLDKLAGDPVDILINGQLVARGEVLVLNDNFCVRVAEILTPES
ncbi:MAG: flagellar motor switch protein FliN [Planctomycetaceae bacterium]